MKQNFLFTAAVSASLLIFAGCSKQNKATISQIPENTKHHSWYFFTEDGFEQTSLPQQSGISSLNPWTETLRASDANTAADKSGYMLVNRLGVIHFAKNESQQVQPVLIQDYELFSNSTASNLIFDNENPYFTLSRSSFFNKEASLSEKGNAQDSNRPFLVRISQELKAFYPIVTYGDLRLSGGGEITGTFFDGNSFFASIKKIKNSKTEFTYINFSATSSLESLSPFTKDEKITIQETSEENYRLLNSPKKFSDSPKRLRSLLSSIPQTFSFSVECKNSGGTSPKTFISGYDLGSENAENSFLINAHAIIADDWICAVFSDGTTYFNGALDGKPILNNGKNAAFRLPKLPQNYIYGPFCISGTTLAVAWEESDFYKTGRSGFLTVDLKKVLYNEK
ncbi:hypothetical protein [Treponema sp.]|uniref:hypothetical protein n=1 Tax=Treponema sp. TaxID=166 RepID=UPI003FD765B6